MFYMKGIDVKVILYGVNNHMLQNNMPTMTESIYCRKKTPRSVSFFGSARWLNPLMRKPHRQ